MEVMQWIFTGGIFLMMMLFGMFTLGDGSSGKDEKLIYGSLTAVCIVTLFIILFLV